MLDADLAATDAGKLARFAERVRDLDAPAAGDPADRVRRLFGRAALVRQWPIVRASFAPPPPTSDATLAERSRQLAERCRGGRKAGWFGGWPKEANELLGEAADRLIQLADRLDAAHAPAGLVSQLNAVLAGWGNDLSTAQLVQLDTTLAGLTDACRTFAHDLTDHPPGHVFEHFVAKLRPADGWTPDARAAAGLVCVLLDQLTQRTSDPPVWAFVRRWAEGWFAATGVSGAVLIDEPPPEGVIAEPFPLKGNGRVVLAVASPGGAVADVPAADVWAGLPPVPVFDGLRCPPLEGWYALTRGGKWDEEKAKGAFREWLDAADGEWFHRWLMGVRQDDGGAVAWWRVLRAKGWCEAFPDPDAKGGAFDWPVAGSRPSERPFGEVVEVRRFAPRAGDSRMTLSDGPVSAAAAAFGELFLMTADDSRWWGGGRWLEARKLCRVPELDRVAAVAGGWLDACQPSEEQVDTVCRWVEACGLTAVRATTPDAPGVTVRQTFAAARVGTVLTTNRAGFRTADEVFRPAVVEVSLGPAPAGFNELEKAAERLPAGSELRRAVAGLRAAAHGNYLREAVLQLYSDVWGEMGMTARNTDPAATAEVGARLAALLTDAFGLRPFHPVNVHDFPSGWISVAAGSRVMTGVVTRVLRPGLQDDHGNLRIPAVVEVE